jgi:hypothetical protein
MTCIRWERGRPDIRGNLVLRCGGRGAPSGLRSSPPETGSKGTTSNQRGEYGRDQASAQIRVFKGVLQEDQKTGCVALVLHA